MSALIMAGGRAVRLRSKSEKPLTKVGGYSMLERVVHALQGTGMIKRIVVACSGNTPRTARKARKMGLEVLTTPGRGYVRDMNYAISKLHLSDTVVVNADLPLINSGAIKKIIDAYMDSGKSSLTVAVRASDLTRMGLKARYARRIRNEYLVPVGINVLDGSQIHRANLEETTLRFDDAQQLLNVNNQTALALARQLLQDHGDTPVSKLFMKGSR